MTLEEETRRNLAGQGLIKPAQSAVANGNAARRLRELSGSASQCGSEAGGDDDNGEFDAAASSASSRASSSRAGAGGGTSRTDTSCSATDAAAFVEQPLARLPYLCSQQPFPSLQTTRVDDQGCNQLDLPDFRFALPMYPPVEWARYFDKRVGVCDAIYREVVVWQREKDCYDAHQKSHSEKRMHHVNDSEARGRAAIVHEEHLRFNGMKSDALRVEDP